MDVWHDESIISKQSEVLIVHLIYQVGCFLIIILLPLARGIFIMLVVLPSCMHTAVTAPIDAVGQSAIHRVLRASSRLFWGSFSKSYTTISEAHKRMLTNTLCWGSFSKCAQSSSVSMHMSMKLVTGGETHQQLTWVLHVLPEACHSLLAYPAASYGNFLVHRGCFPSPQCHPQARWSHLVA